MCGKTIKIIVDILKFKDLGATKTSVNSFPGEIGRIKFGNALEGGTCIKKHLLG
jgi:hypothetical protein